MWLGPICLYPPPLRLTSLYYSTLPNSPFQLITLKSSSALIALVPCTNSFYVISVLASFFSTIYKCFLLPTTRFLSRQLPYLAMAIISKIPVFFCVGAVLAGSFYYLRFVPGLPPSLQWLLNTTAFLSSILNFFPFTISPWSTLSFSYFNASVPASPSCTSFPLWTTHLRFLCPHVAFCRFSTHNTFTE